MTHSSIVLLCAEQRRHNSGPRRLQHVLQAKGEKNNFDWQYISITSYKRENEKTLTQQEQKVKREEILINASSLKGRAECRVTAHGCNDKGLCVFCEKNYSTTARQTNDRFSFSQKLIRKQIILKDE